MFTRFGSLLGADNYVQLALSKLGRNASPLFAADVVEGKNSITYALDVPGVKLAVIDVSVTDDTLCVTAERQESKTSDTDHTHTSERASGKYQRSFRLPSKVNQDSIETTLQGGVLTMKFSKKADSKLLKKVKIHQLS